MIEKYLRVIVVGVIVLCAGVSVMAEGVYEAWSNKYEGSLGLDDKAYALAVDDSGNVYVTGLSYEIETYADITTIKYYANGDTAWLRRFNGDWSWAISLDGAYALALDDSANVYVVGFSKDSQTGGGFCTLKYTKQGNLIWVKRYSYQASGEDAAYAVVVDASHNVYVTGRTYTNNGHFDIATVKYYPNGDTAWARTYNGPGNYRDRPRAIAVDSLGNVYVTGSSFGSGTDYDYVSIKYYPDGDTAWIRRYNGPTITEDDSWSLAVDQFGNVIVSGYSGGDIATIKYKPNGDTAWVRRFSKGLDDVAYAIALDDSGNIYVAGYSTTDEIRRTDYLTIKYYPTGDTAWVRTYNDPGNSDDAINCLKLDKHGNVFVSGKSGGHYTTIQYRENGDFVWVKKYGGPFSHDQPYGLEVDKFGNVHVTGESDWGSSFLNYATLKYTPCFRLTGLLTEDDILNITDLVYLVNIVFKSWPIPGPNCLADVNGDSFVSMADIIYLANHVFKRGPAPVKTGVCCD